VDNRPEGCAQVVDIAVEMARVEIAIGLFTCGDATSLDVDPTKSRARRIGRILHISMSTIRLVGMGFVIDTPAM
jgi:hypothetical protein